MVQSFYTSGVLRSLCGGQHTRALERREPGLQERRGAIGGEELAQRLGQAEPLGSAESASADCPPCRRRALGLAPARGSPAALVLGPPQRPQSILQLSPRQEAARLHTAVLALSLA